MNRLQMSTVYVFPLLLAALLAQTQGFPVPPTRQPELLRPHHLQYECPISWSLHGEACYRYFPVRMTWAAAESSCLQYFDMEGMAHLTSLHDQAENDFVYDLSISGRDINAYERGNLTSEAANIWLGLRQEVSQGPWVWVDGSQVDYTLWLPGQPDNGHRERSRHIGHALDPFHEMDEDCVAIDDLADDDDHRAGPTRQWSDVSCERRRRPFVCKMPAFAESNDVSN